LTTGGKPQRIVVNSRSPSRAVRTTRAAPVYGCTPDRISAAIAWSSPSAWSRLPWSARTERVAGGVPEPLYQL
jgi:hypothetical protein